MTGPGDEVRRGREFDAQNYNSFVDGADFVRVLLRFLADHPSIRANRVVLVPESYGGTRTTVMLNLLLYYGRYADGGSVFQDPALVAAIQAHYDAVFPGYAGAAVPPAVIAGQWGHQVLIQTTMSWHYQRRVMARMLEEPGSPLYQVAAETGVPYVLYEDSPGAVANPAPADVMNYIHEWLVVGRPGRLPHRQAGRLFQRAAGRRDGVPDRRRDVERPDRRRRHRDRGDVRLGPRRRLQDEGRRERRSGARLRWRPSRPRAARQGRIDKGKLAGAARAAAGRAAGNGRPQIVYDFSALVGPPPRADKLAAWLAPVGESEMAAVFGSLRPWDRYFVDANHDVTNAFAWNKATLRNYPVQYNNSELYGRMFLENAAWVETFATNAAWDSVVYTAAVPEGLALHTDILSGSESTPRGRRARRGRAGSS